MTSQAATRSGLKGGCTVNRRLVQLLVSIMIASVLICSALCLRYCAPTRTSPSPLVLVVYRSLHITHNGRKVAYVGSPRAKNGQTVLHPELVEWQGNLLYWSDADKAIAIVRKDGSIRWIEVGKYLSPQVERVGLVAHGEEIWLNLYSRTFIRPHVGVLKVLPRSGRVLSVPGVLEVRASAGGGHLATLNEEARVKVLVPSGIRTYDANFDILDWDYDAHSDSLLVLTQHGVQICQAGSTRFARLPMLYNCRRIYAKPAAREYWVLCHKPFHFGSVVLAYDYFGRFRGKVLETGYECLGVIEPTPQALQIIAKFQDAWRSP